MKSPIFLTMFALAALTGCDERGAFSDEQEAVELEVLGAEDFEGMTPEEIEILEAEIEGTEAPAASTPDQLAAATNESAYLNCRWLSAGRWGLCTNSLELRQRAERGCLAYTGNTSWIEDYRYQDRCDTGYRKLKYQCCHWACFAYGC